MTRVLEFIVAAVLVAVLFVIVGLVLPSERTVSHTVETNRPITVVYDVVNSFKRFKDWSPLTQKDPRITYTASGAEVGEGASLAYNSRNRDVNQGSWKIVSSTPQEQVVYDVENDARGQDKTMTFDLRKTGRNGRNVEIKQTYHVDYGFDLFGRYAGMYVDRTVGGDLKRGLENLSTMLTTIPRFDYSVLPRPVQVVDVAQRNALVVPTNAPRNNDGMILAVENNLGWIERVMESNDLVADGPLRLVTTEYGAENYAFDLVQPVRRLADGEEAPEQATASRDEDEGEDGEENGDGQATAMTGDEEQPLVTLPANYAAAERREPLPELESLDIELAGPVLLRRTYEGRAAMTVYVGHPAGLPAIRDQIRAWLLVHGEETQGRPFDEYLLGAAKSFAPDSEFAVYWPIKTPGQPDWVEPEPIGGEQAADADGEDAEEE
ncbi:SRPBCC family protein [Coralloluteibacterium stylophorae]|uniref:SRPBCC family protein n=1 Tax=Coralloluteibacterium stylophorae TaxID=1776034 RepID=A0A8J8AWR3_9GAMM|nr:SRPBCC family protein [Coralloluteibacterium stylophorae]MBS7456421.1 SRPBCC family protein [Coralloluteibacterium stylophorae]